MDFCLANAFFFFRIPGTSAGHLGTRVDYRRGINNQYSAGKTAPGETIEIIDVLSRIVHVGTAITLVGGSVFTAFVLMPSAEQLNDESHRQLAASVKSRWTRFVHAGILLFLISGFYNYFRAIPLHKGDGLYHALLGTKILLALAVFFLAAALVGRNAKLEPIRKNKALWIKVLVLLAATIVAISGFVKVRGVAAAPSSVSPSVSTSDGPATIPDAGR